VAWSSRRWALPSKAAVRVGVCFWPDRRARRSVVLRLHPPRGYSLSPVTRWLCTAQWLPGSTWPTVIRRHRRTRCWHGAAEVLAGAPAEVLAGVPVLAGVLAEVPVLAGVLAEVPVLAGVLARVPTQQTWPREGWLAVLA
jgi:hypothetical protein